MSQPSEALTVNDPRLDEKAQRLEILISVFLPIGTIALVLRLYARFKARSVLAIDDYLAILAYIVWVVWLSLCLWVGKNGGGWPVASLPLHYREIQTKALYSQPVLAASIMTAVKFSILTLYRRLFRPSRAFRIQSWIVGTICLLWWMAAVFATIFQCVPIRAGWNVTERLKPSTKCVNSSVLFVCIAIPNVILDYVVAAMAIHVVRNLQMKLARKIGLVVMFLLCTFVSVLIILRISVTYHPENYNIWSQYEWSVVQFAAMIICCSIPTYGVFLTKQGSPLDKLVEFQRSSPDHLSSSNRETRSQPSRSQNNLTDRRVAPSSPAKVHRPQTTTIAEVCQAPQDIEKGPRPESTRV